MISLVNAIESERAVLGLLMACGELAPEAKSNIEPVMFYTDGHRIIFDVVMALFAAKSAIDLVSVSSSLRAESKLDDIGGLSYLDEVFRIPVPQDNFGFHMAEIRRAYFARKIVAAANTLTQDPENAEIVSQLQRFAVARAGETSTKYFSFARDIGPYLDRLEAPKSQLSYDTGLTALDIILGGLRLGDLVTIGGRPGGGKSGLLTRLAVNMAGTGVPVLVFSTEMTGDQYVGRVMPEMAKVHAWKFRRGKFSPEDWGRMRDAGAVMDGNLNLTVSDNPRPSLADISRAVAQVKPKVLVVDYLQRCAKPRAENVTRANDEFLTCLKSLALEAGVIVFLGCQLNRIVDRAEGNPRLSDLRDSGAIEQESDIVILLNTTFNDENADTITINAAVEKHRHGSIGMVTMELVKDYVWMREADNAGQDNATSQRGRTKGPNQGGRVRQADKPRPVQETLPSVGQDTSTEESPITDEEPF